MPGLARPRHAPHIAPMSRAPLALLIGTVGLVLYVGVAVSLADHVVARHWALALAYYLVAGLAWTWPAMQLLRWGLRADGAG
jgi:hypothetical protein